MPDVKERSLKADLKGVFQTKSCEINLRILLKDNNIAVDCDNAGLSRAEAAAVNNIIKLAADIVYGEAIHEMNIEAMSTRDAIYNAK